MIKTLYRALGAGLVGAGIFAALGAPGIAQSPDGRTIRLAELRGTINPATSQYLSSVISRAEKGKAEAVLVELDTPGGLLSSVREMAQRIDRAKVPVVVYVTPAGASATSAGALLMLASHVAAMAPGSNIGAAHPVGPKGEDIPGAMGEKAVNDTAAFARGMAELRGRDTALAEAVVSKSQSFSAEEALSKRLIEIVAPTREDLLRQLDGRETKTAAGASVIRAQGAVLESQEMDFGQKLLHLLANPNIAGILMTLGILLIYVEVSHPGITIAGVLGGVCLVIAFMAFQLLPIRMGGIALVVLGGVLLAAEPFVTSGGALAAGGILSFVLGLVWLIDPSETDLRVSPAVWVPAGLALGGVTLVVSFATARMHKLSRETLGRIGGGSMQGLAGYSGLVERVESNGTAGKALLRGELWDFTSEDVVSVGESVEVVSAEGMRIRVRKKS